MKKTTREQDLNKLEEVRGRAKTEYGDVHRKVVLEKVFLESQDLWLERMRRLYIDAYKRGLVAKKMADLKGMALAEMEIERLEDAIYEYTSSPSFVNKVYNKLRRISEKEAVRQANLLKKGGKNAESKSKTR